MSVDVADVEPPETHAVVPLPASEVSTDGCQMWTGPTPTPCDGDGTHVLVFELCNRDLDDRRRNVVCCAECALEVSDS